MKTIHLLQLTTCIALLISASFLACTDHITPGPTLNCTLLNGSSRFYPCEFEIVKVEFCKGLVISDVSGTVTPEHPEITLPFEYAWYNFNSTPDSRKIVTYKVKLHIKRIANASVMASEGYILDKPTGNTTTIISNYGTNIFPPIHPQAAIDLPSLPVGETAVVISDAEYSILTEYLPPFNTPIYSNSSGNVLYAVHNVATSKVLIASPHNYTMGVDAAEAHILINPTFVN